MTAENSSSRRWLALLVCVAAVSVTAAFAVPTVPRERAVVHITEVGLVNVPQGFEILIFSPGSASVGTGLNAPTPLRDTIRLKTLPAITADVTDADVHIQVVGRGQISVGGAVTGGPALHVGATGNHIILMKGGVGIRDVP